MVMDNVLVFGTIGKTEGAGLSRRALTTATALNIAAALLIFFFVAKAKQVTAPQFDQIAVLEAPPWPPTTPPK